MRGQALVYPALDLTFASPSILAVPDPAVLTADATEIYAALYVPEVDDRAHPWTSPLFASSHANLPPALIVVAGRDPLHDDGLRYADALAAAGVPTTVREFPEMPHGFVSAPYVFPEARQVAEEIADACRLDA